MIADYRKRLSALRGFTVAEKLIKAVGSSDGCFFATMFPLATDPGGWVRKWGGVIQ
jgi:hypothetical protein